MAINEVFPNPTVKKVIFQIRFPNLFYIENKIGEFQARIIKEFSESSLIYRRQMVFADVGPGAKFEELPRDISEDTSNKIWQFKSEKNIVLSVLSNSLDLSSEYHKTYNQGNEDKFRDSIDFVLSNFFEVTLIPKISRIGIRYIDECIFPSEDKKEFQSYYNSTFPFNRFKLADTEEMNLRIVIRKGKYKLRYIEFIKETEGKKSLILDFDSYTTNIFSDSYLEVTDKLHEIISNEFDNTIKEPVKEIMRRQKEER